MTQAFWWKKEPSELGYYYIRNGDDMKTERQGVVFKNKHGELLVLDIRNAEILQPNGLMFAGPVKE